MQTPWFRCIVPVLTIVLALTISPVPNTLALDSRMPILDCTVSAQGESQTIYHGGTVQTITVSEYANLTEALAAVNDGEADVFGHRINASDYGTVASYANLKQQWAYDTSTYMLAINTRSYPLGDSHLRRAIAFAIDKTDIASVAMNGKVDAINYALPLCSEYSIEKSEDNLFYDSNLTNARNELAYAGMLDVDNDSMVESSNGSELFITIWYPIDIAGLNQTAAVISSNLLSAGINNTIVPMPFSILQNRIDAHNLSYSLALYHQDLPEYGFEWVGTTFLNTNWLLYGKNVANINDQTLNQLALNYTDNIVFDQTVALGMKAVRAVRDLCPIVPLFEYRWLSVYSEARFEGWANDTNAGAFSAWNPVSVTVRAGYPNEMRVAVLPAFFDHLFSSLNPFRGGVMIDQDWVSKYVFNPYLLIYDSSLETASDGRAVPRLATSWEMLFLGLVPDLGVSQSRAQYYIDPNAKWTDGVQVDAQDYRFTFGYYANNSLTANSSLFSSVKTVGDYVAGVNYDGRDTFCYRIIGSLPLLPRHIWESKDPLTWEPSIGEVVGSGPYKVFSFQPHSSLVLTINAGYYPVPDTEPPNLKSFQIIPENPTPAETVVIRAHIEDRSRLRNVTLQYTYHVGLINFSYSAEMQPMALGYEGTIEARVTATTVDYKITATDIWGNSAIVASGSYSRPTTTVSFWQILVPYIALLSIVAAVVLLLAYMRHRK